MIYILPFLLYAMLSTAAPANGAQESKMGILILIGTVMGLSFVLWIISIAARTYALQNNQDLVTSVGSSTVSV